jgi:hypothetical protein
MDFGLFIAAQHPQGSMAAFLEGVLILTYEPPR